MVIGIYHALPLRRWHTSLAERLAGQGHEVHLVAAAYAPDVWRDVRWLFAVERRLYGARHAWFEAVPVSGAADAPRDVDLAIVLAGAPPDRRPYIQPRFDGQAGEAALRTALLGGRAPLISIYAHRADGSGVLAAEGHPATEDRYVLTRSLDHVLPRLATLLAQAVARSPMSTALRPGVAPPRHFSPSRLLATGVRHRLRRKLHKRFTGMPEWRAAYRLLDGDGVALTQAWPTAGYRSLPERDGGFYADPFVLEHDGRCHVFFEDFSAATRKGVIARLEIAADGTASSPRVVLDQPTHLSYPLLILHGGVVYMLPEMGAARRLQLFRADPFPDTWVEDRVLLDGTVVADATPILHEGVWWIFASLNDDGGSSWDQLALYHAPDLLGPWTPHHANPVLIDAGAARPAGAMWHDGRTLMRVAQDCRDGYGRGLAICRVDRLDEDGFAQTVVARLGAPPGSAAFGAHTLNSGGWIEVIDLNGTPI